jgi:hypothetical protein
MIATVFAQHVMHEFSRNRFLDEPCVVWHVSFLRSRSAGRDNYANVWPTGRHLSGKIESVELPGVCTSANSNFPSPLAFWPLPRLSNILRCRATALLGHGRSNSATRKLRKPSVDARRGTSHRSGAYRDCWPTRGLRRWGSDLRPLSLSTSVL